MKTVEITFNEQTYKIGSLRLGHLREITALLQQPHNAKSIYEAVDRYRPFMFASLELANPGMTIDVLDLMTLEEFYAGWKAVCELSGIAFTSKGETKPAVNAESTGATSTDASPSPLAGHTVN